VANIYEEAREGGKASRSACHLTKERVGREERKRKSKIAKVFSLSLELNERE